MSSTADDREPEGTVVSVSEKGQATIPKELRDRHGIQTPGRVRVRENDAGEIVVEPVPSLREFRGRAATEKPGTRLLREGRERDERRERIPERRGSGCDSPDRGRR